MLCNHNAIKVYKSIAVFMAALIICLSIFAYKPIHKPKASASLSMLACAGITGLIYGGTSVAGYTSGALNIEYAKLEAIQTFVTPLLEAAGSNAIEQANRLGEAIASGAEASVIQGLATGSVIYAFGEAISNVLFNNETVPDSVIDKTTGVTTYYFKFLGIDTIYTMTSFVGAFPNLANYQYFIDKSASSANRYVYYLPYSCSLGNGFRAFNITGSNVNFTYRYYSSLKDVSSYGPSYSGISLLSGSTANFKFFDYFKSGVILSSSVSDLESQDQIGILTGQIAELSEQIRNWDGTSNIVLSPPINATADDVFGITPGYVGADVEKPIDPPAEEEGVKVPWLEAILTAIGVPDTNIASVIEGVEATIGEIAENTGEIAGTISGTLTGIDSAINDFIVSIDNFFALPEDITIFDDAMTVLNDKFNIIPQLNNALGKLDVTTRPLIIYYPYLDGTIKEINLNWYEPMREQVKSGVAIVFEVMTAMSCFAIVSNVFGIGIRVGTKETVTDKPSEKGGK